MNLELLQSLLGWVALINYLLLIIWFLIFWRAADGVYQLHRRWFVLTREQFTQIHYTLMGQFKLLTFALFIAPWLALHIISG